tara:strand:+ start:3790 stop:5385 length:1596 start_codon:yes stop_codon:yes gene_type:complete
MRPKRIITKSPARISFANGGDTDYYLKEIGWGCVLNASLSSLYFQCEVIEDKQKRVEFVNTFDDQKSSTVLQNLVLEGDTFDLVKATIAHVSPYFYHSLNINTNIPRESGLGGSSTLNVALLLALLKEKGDLAGPEKLAKAAYFIERNLMRVPGGYQDQWASAYGRGLNLMLFKDKEVEVVPIHITEDNLRKLEANSLLVYFSRREEAGGAIHNTQEKKMQQEGRELHRVMLDKRANVFHLKEALEQGDFKKFASCLKKDWELKKQLSRKIAVRQDIYETALSNGALAGRLCGAGNGGAYYFYCEDGKKYDVLRAIQDKIVTVLPFTVQRLHENGGWYDTQAQDDSKFIFLDRDGVINKEVHLLGKKEDFELLPRSAEAIKLLNDSGYTVVVLTNQPQVARGIVTQEGVDDIHKHMQTLLAESGARVDHIYYCPHHPKHGEDPELTRECSCRKPKPGLILQAKKDLAISDLSQCYMIGDKIGDIKMGDFVHSKTILVETGYGGKEEWDDATPMHRTHDLYSAVKNIVLGEA